MKQRKTTTKSNDNHNLPLNDAMCFINHHSPNISLVVSRQKKVSILPVAYCYLGVCKNSNFPAWRSSALGIWGTTRIFSSNAPSTSSPQTRKLVQLTPADLSLFIWPSIKAFKGETTMTIDLSFDERFLALILSNSTVMVAFGRSRTSRSQLEKQLNNPDL